MFVLCSGDCALWVMLTESTGLAGCLDSPSAALFSVVTLETTFHKTEDIHVNDTPKHMFCNTCRHTGRGSELSCGLLQTHLQVWISSEKTKSECVTKYSKAQAWWANTPFIEPKEYVVKPADWVQHVFLKSDYPYINVETKVGGQNYWTSDYKTRNSGLVFVLSAYKSNEWRDCESLCWKSV